MILPALQSFSLNSAYHVGASNASTYGAGTPSTSAKAYFTWFAIPNDAVIEALALYLATGQTGAAARLGVYSDKNGLPNTLLADFGAVDLSGAAGMVEAASTALAIMQSTGGVWICNWMKDAPTQASVTGFSVGSYPFPLTAANISSTASPRGYSVASAYPTALPTTAPSGLQTDSSGSNGFPLPFVKIQ